MKRFLLAAAFIAFSLAGAVPASADLTPLTGPGDIIAPYCIKLRSDLGVDRPPLFVPARQPLTLWFAWASKNRGLDMNWINGTELELTINGTSYSNLNSYYLPPGDFHWDTGNPLLDGLWAIAWVFPVPFQLEPGQSFTYTFTVTGKHRLLDLASPNAAGPGNRPYFYDPAPAAPMTCTVTAQSG